LSPRFPEGIEAEQLAGLILLASGENILPRRRRLSFAGLFRRAAKKSGRSCLMQEIKIESNTKIYLTGLTGLTGWNLNFVFCST